MNREKKNYTIGLDIGTTSVGWAVINDDNKLIKKGNNPLWGYSLFDEGDSAAKRRTYRTSRRRLSRRKQRIHLLQDLCSEMIHPIDNSFFRRLKNSYLVDEDRKGDLKEGGILFKDQKSDSIFYDKYPTMYHLRKQLIECEEKVDPRFVYLALHHIVKYRGNFLYEGQKFDLQANDSNSVAKLEKVLEGIDIDPNKAAVIYLFLSTETLSKKERQAKIKELGIVSEEREILNELSKSLLGYKFKPSVITGGASSTTLSFSDANLDELIDKYLSEQSENVDIIYELQSIYSALVLKTILNNSDSISDSMVAIYENHKKELKELKKILEPYPEKRKKVLNEIYKEYINNAKENPRGEFYKKLKKELIDVKGSEAILNKIESDCFLRKQNTTDNGEIPYQLHYIEAEKIIDNQGKYYECLSKNKDKILSLISFKRPYYLGPSFGGDGTNPWAWMVTKNNEPIRPWNWDSIVDVDETARNFIDRMRNHCTYLLEEKTLPKSSIVLNRFNLLNELNKIKLNNKFIFTKREEKIEVINSLFLKKQKVSSKDLIDWLFDHQRIVSKEDCVITGFQSEEGFASSLQSEISIRKILDDKFDNNETEIERIIDYVTVYTDKKIIKRKIKNDISMNLTDNEIERLSNLKLSGYGRFSKKLIDGLLSNGVNRSPKTILGYLYDTNDNFMQILNNSDYGFMDKIRECNSAINDDPSKDIVNELVTSPANKRAINQSLRVVEDIVSYMKHEPDAIYIEFAREEKEKKRSVNRFEQLEKIYKDYCDKELQNVLKQNENQLGDDRIYLYFIQQGKCLYSGKSLDISDLTKYQIDHILPQSYIKDDSLENKALVISSENQRKKDSLLLDDEIISKNYYWWKSLYDKKLIGSKKFRNLVRKNVSDNETKGFIARQLVETRQICVHVRDILKNKYCNTEVGSVHAPLLSEFRHKYKIYKIRNLNSAHHSHDAYLTAMIGRFIKKETPYLFSNGDIESRYINKVISERLKEETSSGIGAERKLYSIVVNKMGNEVIFDDNGEVYWNGQEQVVYTKKIFGLRSYFYNYQTRDYDGSLFNATLYQSVRNNEKTKASANIKNNMPFEKYGGYSSTEKAYALAVEYKKGKKIVREAIDIPLIYTNCVKDYLIKETGDKNVKIIGKIRMNQTFIKDGSLLTMASASEWNIREPLFINNEFTEILFHITKKEYELYTRDQLLGLFTELLKKAYVNIPTLRETINSKFGGDKNKPFISNEESMNYISSLFENVDDKTVSESIIKLLECITSKSHPNFVIGDKPIASRFGRLSGKTLKLDDVEFVYTSPSGIFKTIKKL